MDFFQRQALYQAKKMLDEAPVPPPKMIVYRGRVFRTWRKDDMQALRQTWLLGL